MRAPEQERPWWLLPATRIPSAWWFVLVGPLLWMEYVTGIYSEFPVVYVIPVFLAAWYSGRLPAVTLAVVMPLAHLTFTLVANPPENLWAVIAMVIFRGTVIALMALWFVRLADHERALVNEVQTLKGLLPICSFCKSIKNSAGEWEHLERFIARRSETQFSHGICPDCQEIYYPAGDAETVHARRS